MSQHLPERRSTNVAERWEPLSEFEQVTERMRRMLEQTFGGFGLPLLGEKAGWSPLVDIEETDDAYVVEAELPGVDRKDVNVELVGSEFTVTIEANEPERKGTVGAATAGPVASNTASAFPVRWMPRRSTRALRTAF